MIQWLQRSLSNIAGKLPQKIRMYIYVLLGICHDLKDDYRSNIYFDRYKQVCLGNECFINRNVQFHIGADKKAKIEIGNRVYIGMNTTFVCVSHEIGNSTQRAGKNIYSDIIVKDGVWIGANVTVLPGVTIGKGCVIGAGAVVISDCDQNCLYAGNPAIKIRTL